MTIKAERNSNTPITTSFSWDFVLSANSYTLTRTGTLLGGLSPIDLRSSIAKVKNGNQSSSKTVLFDDVNSLVVGMTMVGTGVTGSPRITSIDDSASSIVVDVTQSAQGDGGMADDASITFSYGGTGTSSAISGLEFVLENVLSTTTFTYNSTTLSPVETLVNDTSVDGSDGVVIVDSGAGIKAASTTTVSGRGIAANTAAGAPYVTVVSTNTITLSTNQTLDDNTPLTFTGSSRNANITFDLTITDFGTKDHTLTLFLDNSLTVS